MLVLDTDILIEVEKKDANIIKFLANLKEQHSEGISLTSPVYAEFIFGLMALAADKKERAAASLNAYRVLDFDKYAATIFAGIKWDLERKGSPIPIFDLLNAAIALRHGATIVTRDCHYRSVRGLKVSMVS